eukprot:gnl/TRDRNA2_/TRDRNA2_189880_c0_seq1.p1 gnl/TRDRNA2_/TRDRNA2_189880_c0~~gnl/TRDRNA2_/TRDRNA2_189880_c0_seq1.p1  ORF type:complete len:315 (+),score=77.89 gnl/TRDRNA2_/TRDRNA2_189880_c0_seq1:49-945(+)
MRPQLRVHLLSGSIVCALLAHGLSTGKQDEPPASRQDSPSATVEPFELGKVSKEQLRKFHGLFDADSDGKVSLTEITAYSEKIRAEIAHKDMHIILQAMDESGDGRVSLEELLLHSETWDGSPGRGDVAESEAVRALETAKFKVADTDGDGGLDEKELPAIFYPEVNEAVLEVMAEHSLMRKDLDHDGFLTPAEFWEIDLSAAGPDGADVPWDGGTEFVKLDKDGDGKISLQESKAWESGEHNLLASLERMFQAANKDGDTHVTADELEEAIEEIHETGAQHHLAIWAQHHGWQPDEL